MKTALVGSTGFVGGNIAAQHAFNSTYHSTDIKAAFGTAPDLLIYAGLPAAKFFANENREADMELCRKALDNITAIAAERTVLISTVDVYKTPVNVDENTPPDAEAPYGANRAWLESEVSKLANSLIVRLPALFGSGLKKNFIYDMLELIPSMLKADKYKALSQTSDIVARSYATADNGFYQLKTLAIDDKNALRAFFAANAFNAMSFTNPCSEYQFYDLTKLWHDITWALAANLPLINISCEPISARDIYKALHLDADIHDNSAPLAKYDMRSKYAGMFGGENGYMYDKDEVLDSLRAFVRCYKNGERK